MLHYIINSSVIWLASLLLYECLFRNESFHQFNRSYLLGTLLAGIVLPKLSLNGLIQIKNDSPLLSTKQIHEVKTTLLVNPVNEISTPIVQSTNYLEQAIWVIYLLGIFIGIIFFTVEVLKLFRLYKTGIKTYQSGSVIIETNKEHCPFSFYNLVFIRSKHDYNESEWKLIFAHENEHRRQLHLLDNILLIILRIIFWFNPLSHIYFRKLRIVHEFQADKVAAKNVAQYGSFLLDISLLQGAPKLAHTFNYSPIKIRIAMLTRTKSTQIKLLKYLTVLPLFIVLMIFCTQTSFSGGFVHTSNPVRFYKDNMIEFGEFKIIPFDQREAMKQQNGMFLNASLPDSFPVFDRSTGKLISMEKFEVEKAPVKLNHKLIYGNEPQFMISTFESDFQAPIISSAKHLDDYLFSNLKDELDKLEDGRYMFRLSNLVVDDQGHIAYFDAASLDVYESPDDKKVSYSQESKLRIEKKFREILEGSIKFRPAMKNGQAINVRFNLGEYLISVKSHQSKLVNRPGC